MSWPQNLKKSLGGCFFGAQLSLVSLLLTVLGCDPVKPSGGRAEISFLIKSDSFQLLEDPVSLRIRVFRLQGGEPQNQEGDDQVFPLEARDQTIVIGNSRGEVIGEGHLDHLVKPGPQVITEPLTIRLREPERRRANLKLDLAVEINIPGNEEQVTYLKVKPIMDSYCISCHKLGMDPGPLGGLALDSFPFSDNNMADQKQIVREMLTWMRDPLYTMPPPPQAPVPEEKIALVEKWLDQDLPVVPEGSDDIQSLAQLARVGWSESLGGESGERDIEFDTLGMGHCEFEDWIVDSDYQITIQVLAVDGSLVLSEDFQHLHRSGVNLTKTLVIPYQEPDIQVQVIVVE
jgi:hypothetical protein